LPKLNQLTPASDYTIALCRYNTQLSSPFFMLQPKVHSMRYLSGLLLALLMVLAGCGSRYPSPVNQSGEPMFLNSGRQHLVNDGETLYVVAWMYDLDFAALARANDLQEPYTLTPGQKLTVDLRGYSNKVKAADAAGTVTRTEAAETAGAANAKPAGAIGGLRRTPLPESEGTANTSPSAATPAAAGKAGAEVGKTTITVAPTPSAAGASGGKAAAAAAFAGTADVNWSWPYRGNIVGRFSETGSNSKGIDIAGKEGDPILAAADGEVVYAGSGLLRYGNLLIIKHNDRYLSAYAHNRALLVGEKARVTKGQKIAELGSSGIDKNMLHFEIRVDGKPSDPLQYLPALK
jgi:lipoprotein NlpD